MTTSLSLKLASHDNSNNNNTNTANTNNGVVESAEAHTVNTAPPSPTQEPAFEMVVLGCGGGPLETDCSGYASYCAAWTKQSANTAS